MQYFALNLTTISPLAIRADHAPGGVASARYIAGSTLVGSLATAYRLFHEERVADFERLFLSGLVQYPNLYPATFRDYKGWWGASDLPIYQAPQTARTCKRFPGFLFMESGGNFDVPHGVRDSLFDWAIFKLSSKKDAVRSANLLKILDPQKECPTCKRTMKSFAEFYRRKDQALKPPMIAARTHTRVQTHTGINRETGTVQEGILYSREVFQEQTYFWGLIKAPDELAEPLRAFLDEAGQSGLIRVGTGRSRGLGKVHLTARPLNTGVFSFATFETRLERFHQAFCEHARAADPTLKLEHFYFALTLHSPAILRDDLLRYRKSISEATLADLLGMPVDSAALFEEIYQVTSTRHVTGWNEVWGLPRFHEYAIETGSVFFFASRIGADEKLLQALFRLEQEGIGQRRSEGFGRLCVSDPFHLEVTLR